MAEVLDRADMTEIAAPATRFAVGTAAAPGALRRFGRWLGSDRIFPRIPFLLVELLFVLVIFVPFLLTIYISVLKWRANRPFESAYFSGLENYEAVLTSDLFWLSIARTFYFAGVAVVVELVVGFVLAMLVHQCTRSKKFYTTMFLIPMMIVPIVVGYNFSMIYIDSGPSTSCWRRFWSGSASIRASAGCPTRWRRSSPSSSPTSGSGPR
jgi:ABC-type sugar transport system permease subunit